MKNHLHPRILHYLSLITNDQNYLIRNVIKIASHGKSGNSRELLAEQAGLNYRLDANCKSVYNHSANRDSSE